MEVEAGRAASNNATYRDIIRASLILDAQYLVLLLPVTYRFSNRGQPASVPVLIRALDLSALDANQRLSLRASRGPARWLLILQGLAGPLEDGEVVGRYGARLGHIRYCGPELATSR